jgi:hypothetical protein
MLRRRPEGAAVLQKVAGARNAAESVQPLQSNANGKGRRGQLGGHLRDCARPAILQEADDARIQLVLAAWCHVVVDLSLSSNASFRRRIAAIGDLGMRLPAIRRYTRVGLDVAHAKGCECGRQLWYTRSLSGGSLCRSH